MSQGKELCSWKGETEYKSGSCCTRASKSFTKGESGVLQCNRSQWSSTHGKLFSVPTIHSHQPHQTTIYLNINQFLSLFCMQFCISALRYMAALNSMISFPTHQIINNFCTKNVIYHRATIKCLPHICWLLYSQSNNCGGQSSSRFAQFPWGSIHKSL